MIGTTIRRMALSVGLVALSAVSLAVIDDTKIQISRALNSPTLAVKYSGAKVALIELKLNGESFGSRTVSDGKNSGETTFSIDILALKDGDNEVEIRLFDKAGRLVGSEKTVIETDNRTKGIVFLTTPRMGDTVAGPVEINVGFGKDLKNTYVSFFVDNQFKSMTNFPPYTYVWDTARETNGWHELEAWIIDDTSSTLKTRKIRVFVNNPGGRTARRNTVITAPKPVAKRTVLKAATKPLELAPASNPVTEPNTEGSSPIKPLTIAGSAPVKVEAKPIAPVLSGIASQNRVAVKVEGPSAGLKPAPIPASVAVGPRLLTPTGRRAVVATPQAPSQPITSAKAAVKPIATTQAAKPAIAPIAVPLVEAASKPVVKTEPAKATIKPIAPIVASVPVALALAPATEPKLPKVARPAAVATKPVAAAPAKVAKPSVKVAASSAPSYMRIDRGTRLSGLSNFAILLDGEAVNFDVAPRLEEGIPVSPFRHLIEKAGGKVDWASGDKAVEAFADGKDIYLKIGDKVARIGKIPVELELAPFLERGRTIVPLSFLRDALKVEIEFDKATGHVLITSKK